MQLLTLTPEQVEDYRTWLNHFRNKYSFTFREPTYEEVPHTSTLFEDEKKIKEMSRAENHILGTYIIDMGTNIDKEQRKIKMDFDKQEYMWFKSHNKLGLNRWGNFVGYFNTSMKNLFDRTDLISTDPYPEVEEYDKMSFEQKVEFCTTLDNRLYNLLEQIYEKH